MFLGLLDPHPDPLVQILPSSKNSKKNLDFFSFVTSYDQWDPYVFGHPGSASGSVSQRYRTDPDPRIRTVPLTKCHGSPTLQLTQAYVLFLSLSTGISSLSKEGRISA
jgi:hypothetical protein